MKKRKKKYSELITLKGKIREKKFSYIRLAEAIDIAPNTLCDKINGYYALTSNEIQKIANILEITSEELTYYFFPSMLNNSTKKTRGA